MIPRGPRHDERQILTMVRWLLYLVFVVIGFVILRVIGPVLAPVLAAAGIAYLLDHPADRLVARGLPRTLAVALLLGAFVLASAAVLMLVVPLVWDEIQKFLVAL